MSDSRVLRVGYVPEHFSSPLLQLAAKDGGKTFEIVSCPSGTGQMIQRLKDGEIDVSIALTESLIAGIAKGASHYSLVGSYVSSPLNWAIITGASSPYNSVADLRGQPVGISRTGSGSQVMASVLALQNGWTDGEGKVEEVKFVVNDTFKNLRDSVNDGSTAFFMWEWFTTLDYHKSKEVRFIGSLPTPWPSWSIAASTSSERAPPEAVRAFLAALTESVRAFDSAEARAGPDVEYIKREFGYEEQDVRNWLGQVKYPDAPLEEVSGKVVLDTLEVLEKAGVVSSPTGGFQTSAFVNSDIAKVV